MPKATRKKRSLLDAGHEPETPHVDEIVITHACSTGQCAGCAGAWGGLLCAHYCHFDLRDSGAVRHEQEDTDGESS
jgi:hypothetical protein